MGLFDFLRPRPAPVVHRTVTRAKDVAVFASEPSGAALERALAREGVQARRFTGPEGRALEILTRFLPSVVLVRADEVDARAVLDALDGVPGLAEVPLLLADARGPRPELRALLEGRGGGVASSAGEAELAAAALELAPELES